jgi:hypothetical protein
MSLLETREVLPTARAYLPVFGDRAGEHLMMIRGRYSAWTHVVFAFLLEAALLGALPAISLALVLHDAGLALGFAVGAFLAWRVFRDRWRCNEAFSSRWCSGLMNLSVLYVPLVALVYANVRGVQKWSGR